MTSFWTKICRKIIFQKDKNIVGCKRNSNQTEVELTFSLVRRVTFPYHRLQYFVSCSFVSDVCAGKNVSKTKGCTLLQSQIWISMHIYCDLSFMSFFNKTIKRQIKINKEIVTEVILSSGGWFPYGIILLVFNTLSTSQWRQFSSPNSYCFQTNPLITH